MLIYIIVGSVRENRTAIKVANWLHQEIGNFSLKDIQTEIIDLKEWDLPIFAGAHPPATGIYDQPKQQQWADKSTHFDKVIYSKTGFLFGDHFVNMSFTAILL